MSLLPRVRQACRPAKAEGTLPSNVSPAELSLPDPDEEANVALLSGTIVEEPLRDKSRDGDPVTVILMSFDAPDERSPRGSACCEVEVPDEIADQQRDQLRAGSRLVVLGRLTGAGGLWATAIVTRNRRRRARHPGTPEP
jgi:hypothetical protein